MSKHEMEFPPLEALREDFGPEFFGLNEWIPSMRDVQELGVGALAAAGGILVTANVIERIEFFADKPNGKAAAAIGIGLLGGFALSRVSPDAGKGLAAGVAGMGIAKLVANLAGVPGGLAGFGAAEVTPTPGYQYFSPTRGAVRGLDAQLERAFARDVVSEDDPYSLAAAEVTDDRLPLGSWLNG